MSVAYPTLKINGLNDHDRGKWHGKKPKSITSNALSNTPFARLAKLSGWGDRLRHQTDMHCHVPVRMSLKLLPRPDVARSLAQSAKHKQIQWSQCVPPAPRTSVDFWSRYSTGGGLCRLSTNSLFLRRPRNLSLRPHLLAPDIIEGLQVVHIGSFLNDLGEPRLLPGSVG